MPQVEISALGLRVRKAIALAAAAEERAIEVEAIRPYHDAECKRARALLKQRKTELEVLERQMPDTTDGDVQIRAEVAAYFADRDAKGRILADQRDCVERSNARLLRAVLKVRGATHLIEGGPH